MALYETLGSLLWFLLMICFLIKSAVTTWLVVPIGCLHSIQYAPKGVAVKWWSGEGSGDGWGDGWGDGDVDDMLDIFCDEIAMILCGSFFVKNKRILIVVVRWDVML